MLYTVTSDYFIVENYQLPIFGSKTRLKDFEKGGLRTKHLRKDSMAEEGLVTEKLQQLTVMSRVSHEEPFQNSSTWSGGAVKSLKFPAM